MVRALILVAVVACGGPQPAKSPRPPDPPSPSVSCTPRWITYEGDVIDLDLGHDRVLWVENEHGRVVAGPRGREGTEVLRRPGPTEEDVNGMALSRDRVVWAAGDGGIWMLAPGAAAVRIGTVPQPTQIEATDEVIVVASQNGIYRLRPTLGELERIYAGEVWVMTIEGDAIYAQSGLSAIVRVPLDGSPASTLVERAPQVTSLLVHRGRVLFTSKYRGVLEVVGSAIRPYALLETPTLLWNLRAVEDRVYFTADNVVYLVRGNQPVPVAVAHGVIGDIEVDGTTLYVATREYEGVRTLCHDPGGPPIALAQPDPAKLACLASEMEKDRDALSVVCRDPKTNDVTYALNYHASGTVAEEQARDGMTRTWYPDGTPRSERPQRGAGVEKHWFANGKLSWEGSHDANGEKQGRWRYYSPDGAERDPIDWEHGQSE